MVNWFLSVFPLVNGYACTEKLLPGVHPTLLISFSLCEHTFKSLLKSILYSDYDRYNDNTLKIHCKLFLAGETLGFYL